MENLKVVFMGTPDFAATVLEELIKKTDVKLVVSQPDRKKTRKGELLSTPVKELALKNNINIIQPIKIREDYQEIIDVNPDIIITCAYGQIISKDILDIPRLGCINVHASLLPKYRGGAPIHKSIINGDKTTGITIMYMNEGMDEGNIINQEEMSILTSDNLETMFNKLSVLGKDLLLKTLPSIINGTNPSIVQNKEKVTYAYNIKKEEEIIKFNTALEVFNQVRGLYKDPGAYFMLDNKRVKVFDTRINNDKRFYKPLEITSIYEDGIGIGCLNGTEIILTDILIDGKKRMKTKDYLKGINKEELLGKKII